MIKVAVWAPEPVWAGLGPVEERRFPGIQPKLE
jgi:hypothetical protein